MAINSCDQFGEQNTLETIAKSSCSKSSNPSSCHLMIDYSAEGSITSGNSNSKNDKCSKTKKASPYLTEDKIRLLSRITEKRLISRKKTGEFVSSFPLAVNIYKANSDEFKSSKKSSKKVKKSVLTLPHEQALLPQTCTVSDMNDSEYFNESKDETKPKAKKRRVIQSNRIPRKGRAMEVFDRDERYCTRFNIDLDSSSTDMINQFTGDGKKVSKRRQNNSSIIGHDVWDMLRNMNRFQFKPSPPLSQDSIDSVKKKRQPNKRRNSQLDTKYIETRRTEHYTYISSLLDKTPNNSQSSIDRVTVIDKQDEYQEICEELKLFKNKISTKEKSHKKIKPNAKNKTHAQHKQNSAKAIEEKNCTEVFHRKGINHKFNNNNLCQNTLNKNQEHKLMLTSNPHVECTNKCVCCHNKLNIKKSYHECNDCDLGGNSDSSNGDFKAKLYDTTEENNNDKSTPNESERQINGITKVVLSKGENILLTKKAEPLNRKSRLLTAMPSASMLPKLTQTEIKRRLAKIKFPLVISARDEICSSIKVPNYDPPQFAGLDDHIWPFMQNWLKKDSDFTNRNEKNSSLGQKYGQGMKSDCIVEDNKEIRNNKVFTNGNNNLNSKNKGKNLLAQRGKNVNFPVAKVENVNIKTLKPKPMRQFKDKMLQLLHKKSSFEGSNKNWCSHEITEKEEVSIEYEDISTNTQKNLVLSKKQEDMIYKKDEKSLRKISSPVKQSWAKGRWASDFIDTVIKKIKTGVYYNQEEKGYYNYRYSMTKENAVQTEMDLFKCDCCQNSNLKKDQLMTVNKQYDRLQSIPGFDNSFSPLQIESINKNQIAIKHCVTNIVVQFDVALSAEINQVLHVKQSASFIPVSVTESQTTIFKSKTTIINAMLPAELCSILPNTMRKILDTIPVLPKIVDKTDSHLSTIAELSLCDSGVSLKHSIPTHIDASSELKILRQGTFSNISKDYFKDSTECASQDSYKELYLWPITKHLQHINTNRLFNYKIDPWELQIFNSHKLIKQLSENIIVAHNSNCERKTKKSSCMELQPYPLNKRQIIPAYTRINFLAAIFRNQNLYMPLVNEFDCKNTIINIAVNADQSKVSCTISNIKVDSLCNSFQGRFKDRNKVLKIKSQKTKLVDKYYTDCSQINNTENGKTGVEYCINNNRHKKKNFLKLYKKCKSLSNISTERSSFGLDKIKNLDDFFQTLGSAKTLTSVFDGNAERKIMSSIKEMKNWMTNITPRQAMLVLLLATKKDTSNLVRYRPVILQGIAVNRITRASELDMEIEVIERENLNTFSQYEGISYLPASFENQDSLLEELYWIAKTTASDYQKTFDESSERLLKSLLEKRKKLNPSYLRVMARYVGLGLLKQSK